MAKRPCNLDISGAFDREKKQAEDVIQYCLNIVISQVCAELKNKKKKEVRFGEEAKKHDGPKLSKQIAEFLVHNYFEKASITSYNDIKILLSKRYGHIDIQTLDTTKHLLNDVKERLEKIPSHIIDSGIPLLKQCMGAYSLRLRKEHEVDLKKLIRMYDMSIKIP